MYKKLSWNKFHTINTIIYILNRTIAAKQYTLKKIIPLSSMII